jgi:uncharacterized protein (TIGR03083 family)
MLRETAAEFAAVLDELPDERWDEPSYCEGWRVRDVVGHVVVGTRVPARTVVRKVAAGGFRLNTVVGRESRRMGDQLTVDDLRSEFRMGTDEFGGIVRFLPKKPLFADNLTHLLDVTEPLGIDVDVPDERLVAALNLLVTINDWGSKKRAKGVRLVATDVDWSYGSGPEVRGAGRHLILALGGRRAVRDQLSGDGVDQLGL